MKCKSLLAASSLIVATALHAATPEIVPALKEWKDADGGGVFKLTPQSRIVISTKADEKLIEASHLVAQELGVMWGTGASRKGDIVLEVVGEGQRSKVKGQTEEGKIPLSDLSPLTSDLIEEGYTIVATPEKITITGGSAIGAYWGTRTLKQSLDRTGAFPCGTAKDWPDYPVRGFMFDCGRKPFSLTTLKTIVDICSYYKLNDLQLHLSDNYIWLHNYPGVKTAQDILKYEPSAGAFRLESKVKGLASTDLRYSKKNFRSLVSYAERHGVKIVPELDVPGHALQLVRVRPDLMYKGGVGNHKDMERAAMLDLTNPKTFGFVASIFDEYIDSGVFSGDVVHIGTDEYYGDAESYRAFADKMLRHIQAKGRTPRFWGSLSKKRGKTPVVVEGTQMNIWSMGWQNPVEAVEAGYKIINILDKYTYAVPNGKGNVGAYCDDINAKNLYENWSPRTFPNTDANKLPKKQVLGGAWAMWNDNSFLTDPGLCGRDLLARIRRDCAAVAAKCWCEEKPARSWDDFLALVESDAETLKAGEPKAWSRSYKVKRTKGEKGGKGEKGEKGQEIVRSDEVTLYAATPHDGKVGFRREGAFYSFDYTLPQGKTVELTFSSSNRTTTLKADGKEVGGVPKRQHFAEACKFFTLPDPGGDQR